jgi:hypothetical protein
MAAEQEMANSSETQDIMDPDHPDHYKVKADAQTLQDHADITSDPPRHAAAHQFLQNQVKQGQQAVKSSAKSMHGKVKKGLGKAFPTSGGKTPFEKAGANSTSQGDKAEQGD